MIVRAGTGWQTLMADLSIILFLVTVAAHAEAEPGKAQASNTGSAALAIVPSQRSEPIAVYRTGEGAQPLADWLDIQARDDRQMLTIVSTYVPGKQGDALARAAAFAEDAARHSVPTRIVVEPGPRDATATLAYDSSIQSPDTTQGKAQ